MKVLVTGSTGYVGSRLVPRLLDDGHEVLAATRGTDLSGFAWSPRVTRTRLDVRNTRSVRAAVKGVDAVIYLVHAMDEGGYVTKDRAAAQRMAKACEEAGVRRIVYLSGIVPAGRTVEQLSEHLRSRLEVEEVFLDYGVPTVSLRAAMVIGSGSTSFELLRRVTERVPFTPLPGWMRSRMQPIAVEDVVELIAGALHGRPRNRHYDVGGPDVVTYPELLALFATVAGLRRLQIPVPFVPRWLVGLVVSVLTEMPRHTVMALVRSLSFDMVAQDDDATHDLLDGSHDYVGLRRAIERSLGPASNATSRGADLQVGAPTDPDWAGGAVRLLGRTPVLQPASLVADLLLGLASPRAARMRPARS